MSTFIPQTPLERAQYRALLEAFINGIDGPLVASSKAQRGPNYFLVGVGHPAWVEGQDFDYMNPDIPFFFVFDDGHVETSLDPLNPLLENLSDVEGQSLALNEVLGSGSE